jgi:hypothetical protein
MPRTTNFRLNQEQEQKLVDYVIQRKQTLLADNTERMKVDAEAWQRYFLDVANRKGLANSIYPLSNLPVPVFAMVMEHFVSRCEDATTGDEPYFHFEAIGALDEQKVTAYNRYFNWKFKQGKIHDELQEAQLPTFVQKAHILKAVYTRQVANWVDYDKQILFYVEQSTGKPTDPVEIPNHGPIIQGEDEFVEMPDPIAAAHADPAAVADGTVQLPTRQHLKADPTFVLEEWNGTTGTGKHTWAPAPAGLRRSEIVYAGPKTENVPFDRFLCPMDAESVEAADVVMELEDKSFSWIRDNWIERPWKRWAEYGELLKHGDAQPKTQAELTTASNAQQVPPENRSFDTANPIRKIIGAWVRRDVLGDGSGTPQEFVVFVDEDARCAIYYEWQAKVCPDMKRPYTVLAIAKVKNRWYGRSIWERAKDIFESIDRMWNGEFYRTLQQANPPKGGTPNVAEDDPDKVEYNPEKYYKLKEGKTIDDLIQYAKIPDTNGRSQLILEYMIFWIQLWLGISNLAQGDYQAINTNTTKYGIAKTLEEASMLGRRWIRRVISADEEHLTKLALIAIATMPENARETYEYADGDMRRSAEVEGIEIRTLRMHVSLVMGKNAEQQDIDRNKTALEVQQTYIAQVNPEVRKAMRPLLTRILEDLGYKDIDTLLPEFQAIPLSDSAMGGEGAKVVAAVTGDPAMKAALQEQGGPAPEAAPAPSTPAQ